MSTSVGASLNEESREWCWAAESCNLFQLTAGAWRGHLFMASVYSSFVGLTKMLLAKKQILLGRKKEERKKKGGGAGGRWFKHFLQGNVNLKEIPTKSEMVPLVKEVRVFHWVQWSRDFTQKYLFQDLLQKTAFELQISICRFTYFSWKKIHFPATSNSYHCTAAKKPGARFAPAHPCKDFNSKSSL